MPSKQYNLEEELKNLNCTKEGLSSSEVKERTQKYGYNELEEKRKVNLKFFFIH